MIREAEIYEPIFKATINVSFGPLSEVDSWYKKHNVIKGKIGRFGAYCEEVVDDDDFLFYHIHFDIYGFTTIVHETNHITFKVLNARGLKHTKQTEEVYCYYQDWLAGQCRDVLEKWTKKKRKI